MIVWTLDDKTKSYRNCSVRAVYRLLFHNNNYYVQSQSIMQFIRMNQGHAKNKFVLIVVFSLGNEHF